MKLPQVLTFGAQEKWSCGIVNLSHSAIKTTELAESTSVVLEEEETSDKPPITISFKDGHQFTVEQRDISDMFKSNENLVKKLKNIDYSKYDKQHTLPKTAWPSETKKTKVNIIGVRILNVKYDHEYTPESLIDEIFSQLKFADWAVIIDFFKNKATFEEFPLVRSYFQVTDNTPKPSSNLSKTPSNPDYLCCYCDIIYPQIVGNQFSRLLLMAPIKNYKKQELVELNKVQYCEIEKTRISEINFLITDRFSEQIEFEASNYMTRVLLHFKKGYISE